MYEGYTEAVREELKTARIVVDRFHVTRYYHQAADDLRQSELRRLKQELPATEYQQLKGSLWGVPQEAAQSETARTPGNCASYSNTPPN